MTTTLMLVAVNGGPMGRLTDSLTTVVRLMSWDRAAILEVPENTLGKNGLPQIYSMETKGNRGQQGLSCSLTINRE